MWLSRQLDAGSEFARHPFRDPGKRPIMPLDGNHINAAVGQSSSNKHRFTMARVERILDPGFDRLLPSSMSLFLTPTTRPPSCWP